MVDFFVQGGGFMWPILIALLFGLAVVGERAYSLVNSSSDTNKFFEDVKSVYDDSGKDKAIEFCESTPGPVASIFLAGLSKMGKQKEEIEKAPVFPVPDCAWAITSFLFIIGKIAVFCISLGFSNP